MFKHLRTKLTVLYASLFVVALAAIALAVYATAISNAEQLGRDQLTASGTVFDNLLATRNDALEDEAGILARDFGFRAAVATHDGATVRSALDNLASRLELNLAFVIGLDGQVTAQRAELDAGLPKDVVTGVLQGDEAASGLFRFKGVTYEAVAAPLRAPATVGYVLFAKTVKRADMAQLERLSTIPLQATIVGRTKGGAWESLDPAHPFKPAADLAALLNKAPGEAKVQRLPFADAHGASLVFAHRLASLGDGQQTLLLRYPLADALNPFNTLLSEILLVGLSAVLLLIFGSWIIARTVTRPLSALSAFAHRLQAGETKARVAVLGGDEIAALGKAFNAMADAVVEREASLLQAKQRAEAADTVKGEFLANMNHELRTPLNGVLGAASVLTSTPLTPDQQKMVDLIHASGEGLQRIVNGLLDLVELSSGEIRFLDEPFDLEAALATPIHETQRMAEAKGLNFDLDVPPALGWVRGDGRRLIQALSSILDNAVKFTDAGAVGLSVFHVGEAWRFEVRDSGVGFGPEDTEALFGAFRQADGSMTRRFGGVGLGLSLARDLARAMGGDIEAVGVPGKGATFILTLPLAAAEAPAVREPSPGVAAIAGDEDFEQPPLRILLAEDNPANRTVVEMILNAVGGIDLTSVENGAEAVEAYDRQAFDIVLMDLQMPVMDGLTAIRLIREHEGPSGQHTPIIVLSANVQTEHLNASAAAGANLHLAKPIVAGTLIGALDQVLTAAEETHMAA